MHVPSALVPWDGNAGEMHLPVQVVVGKDGQVISARLLQPSADPAINQGTLLAARATEFEPAMSGCVARAGTTIIQVRVPLNRPSTPLPYDCEQAAHVIRAAPPRYDISEHAYGAATVVIEVELDKQGHVSNANVQQSSGDALLDGWALRAAKDTTYAPAISNCKPRASRYLYRVTFGPVPGQRM